MPDALLCLLTTAGGPQGGNSVQALGSWGLQKELPPASTHRSHLPQNRTWPGKSLESSSAAREPQLEALQAGGDGIWEVCQPGSQEGPLPVLERPLESPTGKTGPATGQGIQKTAHTQWWQCAPLSAPAPGWCRVTPPASHNAL